MEKIEWKNDMHVTKIRIMLKSKQLKEILNILFMKHDYKLAGELFLNSTHSKRSSKIMKLVKMA